MTYSLTHQLKDNPCIYLDEELKWSKQLRAIDCGAEIIKLMDYQEAEHFLAMKISELLKLRNRNNKLYRKMCRSVYSRKELTSEEQEVSIDLIWCGSGMSRDLENWYRLEELTKYWQSNELRKPSINNDFVKNRQLQLERAKQFPIERLYQGDLRNSGSRMMGLCPFHSENSPSFFIFSDTNTYHCFGCSAHGDAVNFYMQIKGCDFNQALSELGEL